VYALCGFANLGSIGIMLGGLGAMAPSRKKDIAAIVVRAMIAGNVAWYLAYKSLTLNIFINVLQHI